MYILLINAKWVSTVLHNSSGKLKMSKILNTHYARLWDHVHFYSMNTTHMANGGIYEKPNIS